MNKNPVIKETLFLLLGEIVVSALTAAVYFALDIANVLPGIFTYKVFTGAALGTAVTVLNFFFLAIATDRAFSKALAERGDGEMTDEQAAEFAAAAKVRVQAAMVRSQLIRTVAMLGALILGFVLPWFEGIATLVPLMLFRPILMIRETFRKEQNHG